MSNSNANLNELLKDKIETNTGVTASFFDYDAKQEYPAPDGKRLVTCLYRSKAGHTAARPNQAMFIPDWITPELVAENLPVLSEYIVSYLQDMEQDMIRAKHKECSTMLGDSVFSIASLREYLDSKGAGVRLSGEAITAWYKDSGLQEALVLLYTEKAGASKAPLLVEFIGKRLVSLASPKTVWSAEEIEKIKPLLDSAEADSMKAKLLGRIASMQEAGTESLLDAL